MRKIGIKEIEDIALGAALLGAGGGGDPYVGKLMAIDAIQECGEVTMLSVDELPDNAFIMPIAMMGAPTVLSEKAINGSEYELLHEMIRQIYEREIYAVMPIEAGGVNSMLPFGAAARLGLPIVDCDGMGRAFPELQMVTFTMAGVSASPMALSDEKGNSSVIKTITNKWTEDMARALTMVCGGSVTIALYCMDAKTLKKYGVRDIITRSEQLGRAIRTVKQGAGLPEQNFLDAAEGIRLFRGKITDVLREVRGAFNFGKVVLEGILEYKGSSAYVEFQNENLVIGVDGKILATTPDLICLVDTETYTPIPTDALKYGKRALIVGLQCYPAWRSPEGLELVGPGYFGIPDTEYIPVEIRAGGKK